MAARALFGPPKAAPASGGLQVACYLVPVFDGCLVVFDIHSKATSGRWLPWAVIDYGQNPYEAASLLADDWLNVPLDDLSLADVLSLENEAGWELAIVFRAALPTLPPGDAERHTVRCEAGQFDAIAAFDPVDLERWVKGRDEGQGMGDEVELRKPAAVTGLLF